MIRRPLPVLILLASALACNAPWPASRSSRQATAESAILTVAARPGLPTPSATAPSTAAAAFAARPTPDWSTPGPVFFYETAPGETLAALSARFEVDPGLISADRFLPSGGFLPTGVRVQIPNVLETVSPGVQVLPDSEVVYSPSAADFDVDSYVRSAGGFLAQYVETFDDGTELSGAAIVQSVADELSVNPRLLLALLEYQSGWVFGAPPDGRAGQYPIGFRIPGRSGLYQELRIAATQLNLGYYGWREGTLVETRFEDGTALRFHPALNAGSVALMHLLAILRPPNRWTESLYDAGSLPALYAADFGDPWALAQAAGPVLPPGLIQALLELPFSPGERWSLTGGPHLAWNAGTPRGALDFSPAEGGEPCAVAARWATAVAPGIIVRAAANTVALDLDGDGREQTGWVVVYLHLAENGLIARGVSVHTGDSLGHPSCQGGVATGKHVHIARKYNGEWLAADGPVPFVLSGWRAVAGERNYAGALVRDGERVTSDSSGQQGSTILR